MSGDGCQLIMLFYRAAFARAASSFTPRPDQIDYSDLTKPWYIAKTNEAMNICRLSILIYSDECLNAYLQFICVFFNMNLVHDNNDIDSSYSLVNKTEWTVDKFCESAEKAISNVNGKSGFSAQNRNVFGTVAEENSFYPCMWLAAPP